MNEEVDLAIDVAKEAMSNSIQHLEAGLVKIRAGKATPSMLDSVKIDYYGSTVPLTQAANVNTLDARTLTIQPWEKSLIEEIERGIINANLGLAPQNNGESILINVPALTEERRKDLVKQAKAEGENAKVSIRNARRDANDAIKKLLKDGLGEDMAKDAEDSIQKQTDSFIAQVDTLVAAKEKDIMTV
ncbi:MAG: ribosome recycling factor [Flavobacteriales bacterium]|nr:ribosome recycling factor [Flavobacteriales bacterium]